MFTKGDVVLVPFPFRDRITAKVRPALVISATSYNATGDLIGAAITTHSPRPPFDYPLSGWKAACLIAPSSVRMQFATIAVTHVLHRPGRIPSSDLHAIDVRMRQALDL